MVINHLLHGMILQVLILNPSKCLDPAAPSTLKKTHTYILSVCFKFFNGKFWSSQKKIHKQQLPPPLFATKYSLRSCQKKLLPTSPNHSWLLQISHPLAQNHTPTPWSVSGRAMVVLPWHWIELLHLVSNERIVRFREAADEDVSASRYVFIGWDAKQPYPPRIPQGALGSSLKLSFYTLRFPKRSVKM